MRSLFLLSVSTLLFISSACSTLMPGSDPLVVRAEQTARIALDTMDLMLKLEYDNRQHLERVAPEIHEYAEVVRNNGKQWLESLNNVIRNYKANRTEENKASLLTYLSVVESVMSEARKHISVITVGSQP